jgi:hypothetical protein
MATAKITKECLQNVIGTAGAKIWAQEKPVLDGVFDDLYKNYSDGKTPYVSEAERNAIKEFALAANKKLDLGIKPEEFANIVVRCLPDDLPPLPKEYDIIKDAQKAGNNEGTMVPSGASVMGALTKVMLSDNPLMTTFSEVILYMSKLRRGSRAFFIANISGLMMSIVIILYIRTSLVELYTKMLDISPALNTTVTHILGSLEVGEQGYVRYMFNTIYEVCKTGLRFNIGELQKEDVITALKGLQSSGKLLVGILQDASVEASNLCLSTPDDPSWSVYLSNVAGWAISPQGTQKCFTAAIENQYRYQTEALRIITENKYTQLYNYTRVAAALGIFTVANLGYELKYIVTGFARRITGTQKEQLALEGGKKSRRKSRKKTKKRAHKKPRKSRKKTGRRSRKTGRRSRKTGNRKRR